MMGHVVQLPASPDTNYNSQYIQTQGKDWVAREKRLLDKAEFLEAMILVLNDVRLQNIEKRDFSMMEIVSEEIPTYQKRLQEVQALLDELRREYGASSGQLAN